MRRTDGVAGGFCSRCKDVHDAADQLFVGERRSLIAFDFFEVHVDEISRIIFDAILPMVIHRFLHSEVFDITPLPMRSTTTTIFRNQCNWGYRVCYGSTGSELATELVEPPVDFTSKKRTNGCIKSLRSPR